MYTPLQDVQSAATGPLLRRVVVTRGRGVFFSPLDASMASRGERPLDPGVVLPTVSFGSSFDDPAERREALFTKRPGFPLLPAASRNNAVISVVYPGQCFSKPVAAPPALATDADGLWEYRVCRL